MIIQSVLKTYKQVFLRGESNITVFINYYKTYRFKARLTNYYIINERDIYSLLTFNSLNSLVLNSQIYLLFNV